MENDEITTRYLMAASEFYKCFNELIWAIRIKHALLLKNEVIKNLLLPVEKLNLSTKASGFISQNGITHLAWLVTRTDSCLLKSWSIGKKTVQEIKQELSRFNLTLGIGEYSPEVEIARNFIRDLEDFRSQAREIVKEIDKIL